MSFYEMREELAGRIASSLGHPEITADTIAAEFSIPPNIAMGHLALPCFRLAKTLGKQSHEVAKNLAAQFNGDELSVVVAGPYANFRWPVAKLYHDVLERVYREKEQYGSDQTGRGQTVVLEYCSPNIAKKLMFQHIRSTLLGNTLANIYEFLGYRLERVNFIGDWGSQFARLLAGLELWGNKDLLAGGGAAAMDHLFEIYVKFHKALEVDPSYADRASRCLQHLEEQEPKATALWREIRAISLSSVEATLKRMNIRFNRIEGESTYIPGIQQTLEDIKRKAGARLSDGAWIVDVEGLSTPALIQKKDGTTLYLTRDIAAAIDRYERFHADKAFYVVAEQQRLHFQLLFGVLKKMGYDWADACEHVAFGTVLFGSEKMSTREGRVIFLDELLNEAKARALVECTQKNPDLINKEEVAEMVGIGAIVFGELSVHRQRDLEFNWESILALDGETGPYVQYAAVRCQSLLEKAAAKGESASRLERLSEYEFSSEEEVLVLTLGKLGMSLHQTTRENEPYHLTHYLIDLAKAFNRFYYRFPVLQANDATQRRMRLNLVEATRQTLINGLRLLGINCPKEM